MDVIAITLNGTQVSGRPGMTILELAQELGVRIPTLCHDPNLKPVGACRVCLVEEEKSGRLLASCVTPIAPAMVINTHSPTVIENRKIIVKLMLASHPESCILCDKGNRCQLRKIAADLGIGLLDYYRMPQFTGTQEANPFIQRDLSKCILCGKCIRADHELVVVGALDYIHRGFDAKPATLYDRPLEASECTFCGTCVTVCPTGALFERGRRHLGTIGARIPSTCSYCGCGCAIFLESDAGQVVTVSPNPMNLSNKNTLCVKGHYGSDYIHHSDRLQRPMLRKNGELEESDWEEALDFAAKGLKKALSQYGPAGLAFLGSSKCTNEENYLFQKVARAIFGTNNIDNGARLHSGPSLEVITAALPYGAMTNPLQDLEESDVILVIGSNPSASHPVASYKIKRAASLNGAKLIVIDPRKTELAFFAQVWCPIRPATDVAMINGILKEILTMGVFDEQFVKEHTVGLSELKESLAPFDPEHVEEWTGCSASQFQSILDLLKGAKRLAIVYGYGVTHQPMAAEVIKALVDLALLKGCLGEKGGGVYPLDKENNGQGAWDMGSMPDRLPGYQSLDDEEAIERFEKHWGRALSRRPGIRAIEMVEGADRGTIKAMYIMGENPLRTFPDSRKVEKALSNLDFLVVQDLFLTETAKLANAVLPACSFAEKDGTFTNMERRIQRVRKAIDPIHESRPDWEILMRLSERMGHPMGYGSAGEVLEEISSLLPIYSGIDSKKLEKEGMCWPCSDKTSGGEIRLYVQGWQGKKARFFPAEFQAPETKESYPFLFIRGSTLYHFLGGTRSMRSTHLGAISGHGYLEMNPLDAQDLDLQEGDSIKVFTSQYKVSMTVKLTDSVSKGMVFCPSSDRSSAALFPLSLDPTSLKTCWVRIEKDQ